MIGATLKSECGQVVVKTQFNTFFLINVDEYNNTIYAEMVDKNDDIHFVQEVTDHILWHEIHYKLCYSRQ